MTMYEIEIFKKPQWLSYQCFENHYFASVGSALMFGRLKQAELSKVTNQFFIVIIDCSSKAVIQYYGPK